MSPDDPDQIWVLGNNLLRSDDGGASYERIQGNIVSLLPHGSEVMHLDHHEMWIDPDNADHILLGNDGGLYSTWDGAESWLRLNNLPIAEVYAITVDDQGTLTIVWEKYAVWGPGSPYWRVMLRRRSAGSCLPVYDPIAIGANARIVVGTCTNGTPRK